MLSVIFYRKFYFSLTNFWYMQIKKHCGPSRLFFLPFPASVFLLMFILFNHHNLSQILRIVHMTLPPHSTSFIPKHFLHAFRITSSTPTSLSYFFVTSSSLLIDENALLFLQAAIQARNIAKLPLTDVLQVAKGEVFLL